MVYLEEQIPIFIVSAGRSGSTFLAKLINTHPEIVCISDLFEPVGPAPYFDHENTISGKEFFDIISAPSTKPRLRYWRERQTKEQLFVPRDESLVSLLLSYTIPFLDDDPMRCLYDYKQFVDNEPDKSPADHLIAFFNWMKKRYDGAVWVERTGGALALTPQIIKTWPHAKIIHNYRNGCECAISMQNYPFFRMYLKMIDNPDLDEWDFDEITPLENIGKMWSDWVMIAEKAMSRLPDAQKRWVAYEDLMGKTENTLSSLVKYIFEKDTLSPVDQKWIQDCAKQIKPASKKFAYLEENKQNKLLQACKPGLEKLGYI